MTTARRLLLVLSAAAPLVVAAADQATPAADAPHPLQLKVGESLAICKTGTIVCPAAMPICDDGTLVEFELTLSDGLAFRGVKAGETLCSVASMDGKGLRRVYRVTVSQ